MFSAGYRDPPLPRRFLDLGGVVIFLSRRRWGMDFCVAGKVYDAAMRDKKRACRKLIYGKIAGRSGTVFKL